MKHAFPVAIVIVMLAVAGTVVSQRITSGQLLRGRIMGGRTSSSVSVNSAKSFTGVSSSTSTTTCGSSYPECDGDCPDSEICLPGGFNDCSCVRIESSSEPSASPAGGR